VHITVLEARPLRADLTMLTKCSSQHTCGTFTPSAIGLVSHGKERCLPQWSSRYQSQQQVIARDICRQVLNKQQ